MFRSPLMADELLSYYEKELAFIRQMGAEFARENPKIASRLGINVDTIEDPHVSRLVESFAYLNARIHHKLDDDFPEISDALRSEERRVGKECRPSCSRYRSR